MSGSGESESVESESVRWTGEILTLVVTTAEINANVVSVTQLRFT